MQNIEPRRHALAALLAGLAAIGPFSIDTYLPAFPAMAAALGATQLEMQQTLTAYLAPFAFMILWHGSLSDALGRRRVILWALALYMLGSLVCLSAVQIEHLWLGRALQGLSGGAGMVVGRAIVRDLLAGAEAQRLMSRIAMMFAIAPAIAPIIGGWVFGWFGWRAVFGFLVLFGLTLFVLCRAWLPETLPREQRHSLHPMLLGRAYWRVFTRGDFLLLAGAIAALFNGFFIYVLSAPVFLMQHLGVSAQGFAWMFVPTVCGMMLGSYTSGRLAGRLSLRRTAAAGLGVMLAAALINVTVNLWLPPGLPLSVLPLPLYTFGMMLTMPSITLLIMDLFAQRRGLVSSCQSFMQSATNSLVAAIVAPLLWGSTLTLAAAMAAFLALAVMLFAIYLHLHRRQMQSETAEG